MHRYNISLIVPAYNAEKTLVRFLQSVMDQDEESFQFIIVNDGSTDHTDDIIRKYSEKLSKKIKNFLYINNKENKGAAGAINDALKFVEGKYLTWADSDDYLHPENLSKKTSYLSANPDKALVVCKARRVVRNRWGKTKYLPIDLPRKEDIFEDILYGRLTCYSGVFAIKTDVLFKYLSNRDIVYDRNVGQNWQLLLPVAYEHKCGFIEEELYDYYIYSDSHSHVANYRENIKRTYYQEYVLTKTLNFLPEEKRERIFCNIEHFFKFKRLMLCFENNDSTQFKELYCELSSEERKMVPKRVALIGERNNLLRAYNLGRFLATKTGIKS